MPVKVVKKADKYRVVEAKTGKLAKSSKGTPADGGGHKDRTKAAAQARAINSNK